MTLAYISVTFKLCPMTKNVKFIIKLPVNQVEMI